MRSRLIYMTILLLSIAMQPVYGQTQEFSSQKFINKCPHEIFIGAVLEPGSLNKDKYDILDVSINPITVSYSSLLAKSQEISPSYDNMMEAIRTSLKSVASVAQNGSFSFITKDIKSYSDITIDWGQTINLQTLIGVSSNNKSARNKVWVDISQTFFSLDMDLPESLSNDPEVIKRKDELIYIGSIQFGKKVTVLVESNLDANLLKEAINNALNSKGIDEKGKAVLANSTIRIMSVGNDGAFARMNPDNPFEKIIEYFNEKVTPDNFGVPISFTAGRVKDNSVFENKFKL